MTFDWKEFLNLAEWLHSNSIVGQSQEAASRSATSRAYFASFCHARNFASDKQGFIPSKHWQDHVILRKHFQNKAMPEIADDLEELKKWRNTCDYDDSIVNLPDIVNSALMQSKKIISTLK
ncbi:MAG: hypothetical protein L0196_01030 [candidate division Zixibacteria bacterium]|nr:hypothetical protein [candidate division Zixibacteria bacterium]